MLPCVGYTGGCAWLVAAGMHVPQCHGRGQHYSASPPFGSA